MNDDAQQTQTAPEIPDDVTQLLDQADLIAIVQQHGKALDAHRKEMLLLWLTVMLLAGLATYDQVRKLRGNA